MNVSTRVALVCICSTIIWLSDALQVQDLGGNQWVASNQKHSVNVTSQVPGSIYSDLERAGIIENIYNDFNDLKYRWVSYDNWTFERFFNVEPEVFSMERIFLTCHGLDTIGQVFLNGHLMGTTDNMFVRYMWSVKTILKVKHNFMQVKFSSAPEYAKQYFINTMLDKYIIPPVCTPLQQSGECNVNFVRKMQSSFSWDWGPAFPTQGIWRPIALEAFSEFVVRSISVDTHQDHTGHWFLNATVFLEGAASVKSNGHLGLYLNGTLLTQLEFATNFDSNGEASLNAFVLVPNTIAVKPWFPNGIGLQYLYLLTAKVSTIHQSTSKSIKIGFRTIRLVQEKLPSQREAYSFYFEVNNIPIFSKGSNWIPAHVLHELYTEGYIRDLLLSAKLANMNMLRVWGGGVYENDLFYELADEYGILIWQDMMFACALYPTDPKFLSSVSSEIRQQIRRLQHHPSIAIWAGNNENEAAIAGFWWPEIVLHMEQYKNDYRTLYISTIMPIALAEDQTRPFLPSSPSNGIISPRENYTSYNPQMNQYGDVHHYVFEGNVDVWQWKVHPSAKFVSEYGFQSWSSLATLQKFISTRYLKYPLGDALLHREHKENGLKLLDDWISVNLPLPSNASVSPLDDYIYISQVHQAMAIKIQTEFYRRNRYVNENGEGFTMGALYWQLNDIWPTVSWASIEFGGKWKMLHYFARDMFDNLLVDVYEENGFIQVDVIRDDHIEENILITLNVDVYDWSLVEPIFQRQINTATKPFSVTLAFRQNMDHFLQTANCKGRNYCFVHVSISCNFHGEDIQKKNFLLLDKIKNAVGLQKAQINIKTITGPKLDEFGVNTFRIQLESNRIAPFVWLDFATDSPISGLFSRNGFVITNQTQITFKTREKVSKMRLLRSIVIKSLKDVL